MTVKLYKYAAENIRANKGPLLTNETSFNADLGFEGNQNVETPSIIIQSAAEPAFNYAYIDGFKRYYYITAKTWLSKDLWRLTLAVDPLYTFYSGILQQSGTVLYSGKGNIKKYDPRVVYNDVPQRSEVTANTGGSLQPTDGDAVYFILAVSFANLCPNGTPANVGPTPNQTSYIAFSRAAYVRFMQQFMHLSDEVRTEISKTIISATVARWLDFSKNNIDFWTNTPIVSGYQTSVYFADPKSYTGSGYGFSVPCQDYWPSYTPTPDPAPVFQLSSEAYLGRYYLEFTDYARTYAERKAQRLIDIPFVGQMSIDLDNLGVPLHFVKYKLGVEIAYDFGGNAYVVTPGYTSENGDIKKMTLCRDCAVSFPNNYTSRFIMDTSYQAETETKTAQLLSLLGTAAAGIMSGIATEGATVPATIASLGIGAANMQLTEQRMMYQQGASLALSGTSNGGSRYTAFLEKTSLGAYVFPKAKLYKRINTSSTNVESFQTTFGKPDGQYRTLSELVGFGFTQLGTVVVNGFEAATNNEKNMIRDALLSGVIL